MSVDAYIEALLFIRGTAVKKTAMAKALGIDEQALAAGILALRDRLQGAIRLVETDTELQLMTAPELSEFVESLQREELKKDIGKAGAETLAIVLYKGPVSRVEIDAIRGVNSATMLRNLMVRGLIERQPAKSGGGYQFVVSAELYAQLGITKKEDLPGYSGVLNQLDSFEEALAKESAS